MGHSKKESNENMIESNDDLEHIFEQSVKEEQLYIEEQVLNQLNVQIELRSLILKQVQWDGTNIRKLIN